MIEGSIIGSITGSRMVGAFKQVFGELQALKLVYRTPNSKN